MDLLPRQHGGLWFADLRHRRRDARQYHHRLRHLSVHRYYPRLDQPVDAGGGGCAGYCRHVLAGAEALRDERQRRRSVLYLSVSHARHLLTVGEPGAVAAELRQDRFPGSGADDPRLLRLYPQLAVARSPDDGAQYRQLLYLGSIKQPFGAGDLADADWLAGGDGRRLVRTAGRRGGRVDY